MPLRPAVIAAALMLAAPAVATAGSITGTAYLDRNSNGTFDISNFTPGGTVKAGDVGVPGVVVNAYDSTGAAAGTATTANDGTYTLTTSATGTVRLEFSTPAGYQPSFHGARNGTSVQFVSASTSGADFALGKATEYCQDNPSLVTCAFPIADSQTQIPNEPGGFLFPASLAPAPPLAMTSTGQIDDSQGGNFQAPTTVATGRAIGATFGVGVDRSRNVFFGTYVKRHSEYGRDGSGAPRTGLNVYRVNLDDASRPSALTPWVTLGSSALPAHNPTNPAFVAVGPNDFPYAADGNRSLSVGQQGYSSVYSSVGRAGLGDVDVSPDGTLLYAIEMTEGSQRFWEVPIQGSGQAITAGTPAATSLAAPTTFNGVRCAGTWHPMGIGVRGNDVLIGGVCGGEGLLSTPVQPLSVSVASRVVTVTTAVPHELEAGDYVQVSSLYTNANGVQVVTAATATTFTYTSSAATAPIDTGGTAAPANSSVLPNIPGGRFTSRTRSAGTATLTTTGPHGLAVGDWVTVVGAPAAYNGLVRVSAVTSTTFSYANSGTDEGATAMTQGYARRESAPVGAFVQKRNGAGGFDTIAAVSLGYPKSTSNGSSSQFVGGTGFEWLLTNKAYSGAWRAWTDSPPTANFTDITSGSTPFASSSGSDAGSFAQPMLANIEIMDDGSLVLGLRDRYMDQVSPSDTLNYERSTETLLNQGQGAAEILKLCESGGTYAMESAGACGAGSTGAGAGGATPQVTGTGMTTAMRDSSPLYYWNAFWSNQASATNGSFTAYVTHAYTGLGGTASLPGTTTLWSTSYDIDSANQQGIRVFGRCAGGSTCGPSPVNDGATIAGAPFRSSLAASSDKYSFKKGNGLGDLELVCNAAPVEIGNRVWIDTNANGVQDAGEAPVAGITVRLYNASNQLVGTAITNASGEYYFDSTVTEAAAGTGDHIGGGLVVGEAFTVRLDRPEDFYTGGPLAPYALTQATQPSTGAGSQSTAVDSNAAVVSDYPQISVPSRNAGFNNHTFDVGFVSTANPSWPQSTRVGMGNFTWIDSDRDGVQDAGEAALPGVQVQLLDANGNTATDADGNPVGPVTTDAQGAYFVGNLLPGTYRAQFTLPSGYSFTITGGGTSANDSNPIAGVNPLVGTTPAFTIAGSQTGDTTAVSGRPNATFANLTIDAGVVPTSGGGGGSGGAGSNETPAQGSGGANGNGGSTDGGAGSAGAREPMLAPTAARSEAVLPASGLRTDRTTRIVIQTRNRRDSAAPIMRTSIRVPAGFRVVAAPGGTILAGTVSFTSTNVGAGRVASYTLFVRPDGRARTVRMPVTVTMTSPATITRSTITLRVRQGNPLLPAVTG